MNLFKPTALRIASIGLLCFSLHGRHELFGREPDSRQAKTVEVRILDELGKPTAARVRFVGPGDTYFAPHGHQVDFGLMSKLGGDVILDNQRRFAYNVISLLERDGKFPSEETRQQVLQSFLRGKQEFEKRIEVPK